MAQVVRDRMNFKEYPGKLVDGIYNFYTLYGLKKTGKVQIWHAYVKIVSSADPIAKSKAKLTADTEFEIDEEIDSSLLDNIVANFPSNTYAVAWTTYYQEGSEKRTISNPTIVKLGKNLGRSNQTTPFTQALIATASKYNKKVDAGYTTVRDDLFNKKFTSKQLLFPMLLHNTNKHMKKIKFPAWIQRKMDGNRVVATWIDKGVVLYTRTLKHYPSLTVIEAALTPILKENPKLYLDAELFKFGVSLNEIGSQTRSSEKTGGVEFHIFDCFEHSDDFKTATDDVYDTRKKKLETLYAKYFPDSESSPIKITKTVKVASDKEMRDAYAKYLKEQYEGLVVRNQNGKYETAYNKDFRSYDVQKLRPIESAEGIIIGYKQGDQGKDVGAVIWILRTIPDTDSGIEAKDFTAHPKGITYPERYQLYTELEAGSWKDWKGKLMTYEYSIMLDGTPQQPKAVSVRSPDDLPVALIA